MAIVVESTASNSTTSSTNLTITAPTGITEGDLLVASVGAYNATYSTPSGWTSLNSSFVSASLTQVFYKVAVTADETATDYTFVSSNSQFNAGSIMRVSGAHAVTPFEYNDSDANSSNTSTSVTFSTSNTPSDNSLLGISFFGRDGVSDGAPTTSNYSVTGLSATWNEVHDASVNIGSNADPVSAAAYAIISTGAAITAYSLTTSIRKDAVVGVFYVITARVDANAANTFFSTDAETFTQTATADTITPEQSLFLEATATVNESTGSATSPTQWTNEAKPTTTWTNETL